MPARQIPSSPCVRQHCPSDRCEPYRVQPQLLWEVVKQVGETVPLEQQHVCIAPVSVGFLAFEPLDGEVFRVRRFGFVFARRTISCPLARPTSFPFRISCSSLCTLSKGLSTCQATLRGWDGNQACQNQDGPEANFFPNNNSTHRPQSLTWVPQPI